MLPAVAAALATVGTDPDRDRPLMLVTDGQIGNEAELHQLAGVQVFVIGLDKAPNAGFLERLCACDPRPLRVGRGGRAPRACPGQPHRRLQCRC